MQSYSQSLLSKGNTAVAATDRMEMAEGELRSRSVHEARMRMLTVPNGSSWLNWRVAHARLLIGVQKALPLQDRFQIASTGHTELPPSQV